MRFLLFKRYDGTALVNLELVRSVVPLPGDDLCTKIVFGADSYISVSEDYDTVCRRIGACQLEQKDGRQVDTER